MPCTAGGTPVTIDRLLGLVNVGTTASTSSAVPFASTSASHGAAPLSTTRVTYSGSHPSTHTTTTGPSGHRYRRPFTTTPARVALTAALLRSSRFDGRTMPRGRFQRPYRRVQARATVSINTAGSIGFAA
jgi:hypothetical protein